MFHIIKNVRVFVYFGVSMCNRACLTFIDSNFSEQDFRDCDVLEVGSYDVNGSARPLISRYKPKSYTGVDICEGPGVDKVCAVHELVDCFGKNSFDVVLSTEMLEHVEDWRQAVSNLKEVLKPQGLMIITTRSKGCPYHGYPYDYWRFEIDDFQKIFSDMNILLLEKDTETPGVFLKARKREKKEQCDVANINSLALYSIRNSRLELVSPPISMIKRLLLDCQLIGSRLLRSLLPARTQEKVVNFILQKFLN
jgi:SAM-dependent methyltransferase